MSTQPLYQACSFYMLRTPLYPIDLYKKLCFEQVQGSDEEIMRQLEDQQTKEAIEVGSPKLFSELGHINEKVVNSSLKYLIRMSTRTTPYGLFAGIDLGYFDNHSEVLLNDRKDYKKRLRPDMEWLYGVIGEIEHQTDHFPYIKVRRNNLVYQKGDRLVNPYVSNLGLDNKKRGEIVTSVRYSKVLRLIMELTEEFITVKQLITEISPLYPGTKSEKIYGYLQELLDTEYLISDLRPPLTEIPPFEYLLNKAGEFDSERYHQLLALADHIDLYNHQPIGSGIDRLSTIIKMMETIYSYPGTYVQVDMGISTLHNQLNQSIAKNTEDFCRMLQKLGTKELYDSALEEYKDEFINLYGSDTEVALLELLDEDIGLGSPAGYLNPRSLKKPATDTVHTKLAQIKSFLRGKMYEALSANKQTVQITDQDIAAMCKGYEAPNDDRMAPSIEFNMILSAKSAAHIDNEDYLLFLGPNFGSYQAGKVFGRFSDILEPQQADLMKAELFQKEQSVIGDDYITAELTELAQFGRHNNLTINSNHVPYQISLATNPAQDKPCLKPDDLYIGIDDDVFYIKSRSLDKKVYVTCHNMLNELFGSNIGRFLRDITFHYYHHLLKVITTILQKDFDIMPRLRYGNIVISPSSWKIKKDLFDVKTYSDFEKTFMLFRREKKLPRYVYDTSHDNRLMLDLDSPVHRKELYRIVKNAKDAVLLTETEFGENLEQLFVKDQEGSSYCCEIVIPLIRTACFDSKDPQKQPDAIATVSDFWKNKSRISLMDKKRNLFPGDLGWYYYKFYGPYDRMDELLGDYLYDFFESLVDKKLIRKYFFLRYADPKRHIRLRFQINGDDDSLIQKYLRNLITCLRKNGLVYSVQTDTYVREIERYGGSSAMDDAETYFYADSRYVGDLLKMIREKEIAQDNIEIGMISILAIMEHFQVTSQEQEQLFSNLVDRNTHRAYYQKDRKKYIKYADWEDINRQETYAVLLEKLSEKKASTNQFRLTIDNCDEQGLLCSRKDHILLSMIHMFCNRFNGDRDWETLVMALVRHSLYDLKLRKKSEEKKLSGIPYDGS